MTTMYIVVGGVGVTLLLISTIFSFYRFSKTRVKTTSRITVPRAAIYREELNSRRNLSAFEPWTGSIVPQPPLGHNMTKGAGSRALQNAVWKSR